MRISDIYHNQNLKNKEKRLPSNIAAAPTRVSTEKPSTSRLLSPTPTSDRYVFNVQAGQTAKRTYGLLIRLARTLLTGLGKNPVELPDLDAICEQIDQLLEGIQSNPARILEFVDRNTPNDYLPGHIVNVTILSMSVACHLRWPLAVQRGIGLGALFHDAGLVFHRPHYASEKTLTAAEKQILRKFPEEGMQLIKLFVASLSPEAKKIVENVVIQSQERISGEGHPSRLAGDQVSREAQVVGLCDTYEAISHPRPYRAHKLPHETLIYLIELSGIQFDGSLIKALWETLSLFPPGSYVQLSSSEVARVIDLNPDLPTRPVVQTILNAKLEPMTDRQTLDLARLPQISITRAVNELTLKIPDKKFLIELRAQKWWVQ